jgi:hypothetical protein
MRVIALVILFLSLHGALCVLAVVTLNWTGWPRYNTRSLLIGLTAAAFLFTLAALAFR